MRILTVILVVVLLPFGVLLVLLESPDTYRNELQRALSDATGYDVTLDTLTWRYWPPVALTVTGASVSNSQLEASVAFMELSVSPGSLLLDRHLDIQAISLRGIDVSLTGTRSGNALSPAPVAVNNKGDQPLTLSVEHFEVNDLSVRYDSPVASVESHISYLSADGIRADAPHTVTVIADLRDVPSGAGLVARGTGALTFNSSMTEFHLSNWQLQHGLTLPGDERLQFTSRFSLDWKSDGRLEVTGGELNAETTQVKFDLKRDLSGLLTLNFKLPETDLRTVSLLESQLADLPLDAVSRVAVDGTLGVQTQSWGIVVKDGLVDDTQFSGWLNVAEDIRAQLNLSSIALDRYQPAAPESGGPTSTAPQGVPDDLIPFHRLPDKELHLNMHIETLNAFGLTVTDVTGALNWESGVLKQNSRMSGYGGHLTYTLAVTPDPQITGQFDIKGSKLDLTGLTGYRWITGGLDLDGTLNYRGNRLAAVQESVSGQSHLRVVDGSLDVRPVKALLSTIDLVRGKSGPHDQWPDQMTFHALDGSHSMDGTKRQQFAIQIDNLTVEGSGSLDLVTQEVDYELEVTFTDRGFNTFIVSPDLIGIHWPIRCSGSIQQSFAELCFHNQRIVETLVKSLVRQEVRRRGKEKIQEVIEDKVPEQLRDLTRGLLEQLLDRD